MRIFSQREEKTFSTRRENFLNTKRKYFVKKNAESLPFSLYCMGALSVFFLQKRKIF